MGVDHDVDGAGSPKTADRCAGLPWGWRLAKTLHGFRATTIRKPLAGCILGSFTLLVACFSEGESHSEKSEIQADSTIVLDAATRAKQLFNRHQYQEADSTYSWVVNRLAFVGAESRQDILLDYVQVLIQLRKGAALRYYAQLCFRDSPSAELGVFNEVTFYLYTAMGHRYEHEYCQSVRYLDSLSMTVSSNDLASDFDTTLIIDNYMYAMRDTFSDLSETLPPSVKEASQLAGQRLACFPDPDSVNR